MKRPKSDARVLRSLAVNGRKMSVGPPLSPVSDVSHASQRLGSSLSFEVSHSVARQEVREIAGDGVFVEQETLLMLKMLRG